MESLGGRAHERQPGRGEASFAAGTVITSDYLPWARVLAASLKHHNPDARFAVLVLDAIDGNDWSADESFEVLRPADLAIDASEYAWMASIYDGFELSCALKPHLLEHLLSTHDAALYFDSDILVEGSLESLADRAREYGLVLTPHALEPLPDDPHGLPNQENLFAVGQFNAGFIAVGARGRDFLHWWSSRLARECVIDGTTGHQRFVDQRWLDLAVGYFAPWVARDRGANLAYWNIHSRTLTRAATGLLVDGEPLMFAHFSGFDPLQPGVLSRHAGPAPRPASGGNVEVQALCDCYADLLIAAGFDPATGALPTTRLADQIDLTPVVRRVIRFVLLSAEQNGQPVPEGPLDGQAAAEVVAWLAEPGEDSIPRYLAALRQAVPEVERYFGDLDEAERYIAWASGPGSDAGLVPAAIISRDVEPAVAKIRSAPEPAVTNVDFVEATPERAAPTVSDRLRMFTDAIPRERGPILDFAIEVAAELPADTRLLDVGAGNSPYRELFEHVQYESSDWENSVHEGARVVDHVGSADDIPVGEDCFDAVLCTQVLEHVPDPVAVINEFARILKPGGRVFLTMPLVWELHELPYDFYRYTPSSLYALLEHAGFGAIDIRPRNDAYGTLAELMANMGPTTGRYPDGRDAERMQAVARLGETVDAVAAFGELDARRIMPLGWSVAATLGGTPADARCGDRDAVDLADARSQVTLCFATDLIADPSLLAAYASVIGPHDDATLVVYVPDCVLELVEPTLLQVVQASGVNEQDLPDVLVLPYPERAPDERALAAVAEAILSLRPPWGAFAGRPWVRPGALAQISPSDHIRAA